MDNKYFYVVQPVENYLNIATQKMAQLTVLIIFSVFINFAFCDDIITAKPVPTESYRHSLSLDEMENYYLFWTFDEDFITFEVHVKTQGWVGFGMSSTGGMKGADIVVGWVKNGQAQLHVSLNES